MADQKLSQLTETTTPAAADTTYVVQGGVSKKAQLSNVQKAFGLDGLTTTEKGTIVGAINEVDSNADAANTSIGTLASLTTTEKTNLVGAVNEVNAKNTFPTINIGETVNTTTKTLTPATELLPYGDFESVGLWEVPLYWGIGFVGGDDGNPDYSKTTKSTDKDTGTYALSMECYNPLEGFGYLSDSLDADDDEWGDESTIQVTGRIKIGAGTAPAAILILECRNAEDTDNLQYMFSGDNAGTWQSPESGGDPNAFMSITPTGSYSSFDSGVITFPAGSTQGEMQIVAYGANGDKVLYDNVEVKIDGVNQSTNSGMEDWQDAMWDAMDITANGNTVEFTDDSDTGSHALKITNVEMQPPAVVMFKAENLPDATPYNVTVRGKVTLTDPPGDIQVWILSNELGSLGTNYWTGEAWAAMADVATLSPLEAFDTITAQTFTTATTEVTTQEGGGNQRIYLYVSALGSDTVATLDNFSIETLEAYSKEEFGTVTLSEAIEDLESGDKLAVVKDKNGVVLVYFDPILNQWVFPLAA